MTISEVDEMSNLERAFLVFIVASPVLIVIGIVFMYIKLGILPATLILGLLLLCSVIFVTIAARNAPTEEELLKGTYKKNKSS